MRWLNPLCILHFFPTDCHRSFLTLLSRDHAMVTWGVDDVGWKIDFLRQTLPFAASCAAGPSESGEELHGCFFLKKYSRYTAKSHFSNVSFGTCQLASVLKLHSSLDGWCGSQLRVTAREAHSEALEVLTTFCESTCVKARVHNFLTCCTQSTQRMVTAGYSRNFMQPFQFHKHRCIWCMWQVGWTIMDMKWWMLSVGRLVQASICDRSAVIFGPVSQHPLLTATGRSFFLV